MGNLLRYCIRNPEIEVSQSDGAKTTSTVYCFAKYMLYGWSGGFYHCGEFKSWMKFTWICINIVASMTILVVGCFGYWITTNNKTFADKSFALAITSINFFAIVVMPVMTYCFKEELETILLHFVKGKLLAKAFNETDIRHEAQRHLFYALGMSVFVGTTYILMHPALMLFYGSTKLHSLQHYLYPVPWINQIDSLTIYFLISLVHCTCATFTISVLVALPPFLMIIAFEFYFAFTITGNLLEEFSGKVQLASDEYFTENVHQHNTTTLEEDIKNHQLKLLEKVTSTALDHQQILKKIKLIKPFVEILFSLFLPCFVVASCFMTYMYISQKLTLLQKIKTMGIVGGWSIMMFSFTHVGKLFAEMEETFSNVVYGFPWYYLNPKQRRVFYIFLNQTKHPVRFHALTMYSMVPMTSLNCIKLIYSFGNLLRNQINRKQVK